MMIRWMRWRMTAIHGYIVIVGSTIVIGRRRIQIVWWRGAVVWRQPICRIGMCRWRIRWIPSTWSPTRRWICWRIRRLSGLPVWFCCTRTTIPVPRWRRWIIVIKVCSPA